MSYIEDLKRAIGKVGHNVGEVFTEEERRALLERIARVPESFAKETEELHNKVADLERALEAAPFARSDYTEKAYWACVRTCAEELLEQDEDERSAYESIDGTSWCIYYYAQKAVLVYTSNIDAWEELGELPKDNPIGAIAAAAMAADVEECLAQLVEEKEEEEAPEEEE